MLTRHTRVNVLQPCLAERTVGSRVKKMSQGTPPSVAVYSQGSQSPCETLQRHQCSQPRRSWQRPLTCPVGSAPSGPCRTTLTRARPARGGIARYPEWSAHAMVAGTKVVYCVCVCVCVLCVCVCLLPRIEIACTNTPSDKCATNINNGCGCGDACKRQGELNKDDDRRRRERRTITSLFEDVHW
jgi:hypothetical protein